jgi:hypothetical protein
MMPSDTFLNSFNQAFMMGHTIENDNRQKAVAQEQAQLRQMQMQKLAGELQQQDILNNPESPKYKPVTDMLKQKFGDDYIQLRQAGITHDDIVKQKKTSTLENWIVSKKEEADAKGVEVNPTVIDWYNKIKGRKDEPYKVGQILPGIEEGDKHVTKQVTGYDNNGMPILKTISTAPRYKPDNGNKPVDPRIIWKDSATLRKEYNNLPEVKESNQTMPKIENMEKAYSQSLKTKNFVAVDQALITLFNKLTDPNSVVRESEYARTAQNIPLLNNIKGKAEKVLYGGAGLTTAERNELIKMARSFKNTYKDIRTLRHKEYSGYAHEMGLGDKWMTDPYKQTTLPEGFKQGW